jgi:mono/diheme cytochrome c family protein
MKWYIALGMAAVGGALVFAAYIGFTEQRRMADFTQAFHARQIENGATMFGDNCAPCHGVVGSGSPRAPALNARDLFDGTRLNAIGWSGTTEDYVRLTIAAGRPKASEGAIYPERMPTWGQQFGGPMRPDQIESLVAFIMNWEERALAQAPVATVAPEDRVGTDITAELPEGDAARGAELASSALGCGACHILGNIGPVWAASDDQPGLGERAGRRYTAEAYSGTATSAAEYLFESVVLPNAHVLEGFEAGVMPADFANRLTPQDVADLIAYMLTFR